MSASGTPTSKASNRRVRSSRSRRTASSALRSVTSPHSSTRSRSSECRTTRARSSRTAVSASHRGQAQCGRTRRSSTAETPSTVRPIRASRAWASSRIDDGKEYLAGVKMADIGDVVITPGDLRTFVNTTTAVARQIAEREAVLVSVGGDHSITFPLVRGMEPWGEIELLHFDAHFDVRDTVAGSPYSHSSPIRRISELPFVSRITQFGIRNFASKESLAAAAEIGSIVVPGAEMHRKGPAACVAEYAPTGKNVYVTIDTGLLRPRDRAGNGATRARGLHPPGLPGVRAGDRRAVEHCRLRHRLPQSTRRYRLVRRVTTRLASYVMAYTLGYVFDARRSPTAASAVAHSGS